MEISYTYPIKSNSQWHPNMAKSTRIRVLYLGYYAECGGQLPLNSSRRKVKCFDDIVDKIINEK